MKIISITKSFSAAVACCFILIFIFCAGISAQKDIKKKNPTTKKTPTTETPIETPSPVQKETPSVIAPKDTKSTTSTERKKIIVVLDFDDVTLGNEKMQIGRQIAILLANELSKNGAYTVIERQRLAQVLKEQDLSSDERFDQNTAASVGKALSANPVVLGTITEYTMKKSGVNVMGFGKVDYTAKLGLAIRLVDVNTSAIMDSVTVEEKATERGIKTIFGGNDAEKTEDLKITLFTKAANLAVVSAVSKLNLIINKAEDSIVLTSTPTVKLTETPIPKPVQKTISMARVAEISGTTVYITGFGKNIKVGDLLSIIRGKEIKNPVTGEVVDFDGKEIAKVEVFEVRENTIKARVIKGAGIKISDFVQPIK